VQGDRERVQQLVFISPGEVEWQDWPQPVLQSAEDALVRPLAVASCDLDAAMAHGRFPAVGPFALGHEFIGEVVDAGDDVIVPPGQLVAVPFQISCGRCDRCSRGQTANCRSVPARSMYGLGGLGGNWGGAFSDLVRVPFADHMLVPVPPGVDPEVAASVGDNIADAWRAVVPALRARPGSDVLIVGGGGATSIGLYCIQLAKAHGAGSVRYLDHDDHRLALAARLGAERIPIEADGDGDAPVFPHRIDPAPITVDASARAEGLAIALRSTEPGGTCTNVGVAFEMLTPIPLLEMYGNGLTLHVGRAHARLPMPELLAAIADGTIHPEQVTTASARWDEAAEAMSDPPAKLVVTR
jgi:alcohol dehydrogenase